MPEYSPSASECLWVFDCSLSVFKCTLRAWMSNQMWLEQIAKHKNMFHVKRSKCKKKKMIEKNLRSLLLKKYQSSDLKSFWNWVGIPDLCKDFYKILLFVWAPFIRNFRLVLTTLTLALNKKSSSEVHFKVLGNSSIFLFCAGGICFGVKNNVANYSFINRTLWKFQIKSFLKSYDISWFFRHVGFPRSGR